MDRKASGRPFDYSKLKARTAELGKTDRAVAVAVGMTPSTYSLKLNGKGVFSQKKITSICDFQQNAYNAIPHNLLAK